MTLEKYLEERILQHMRPNTISNDRVALGMLDRFKQLDECSADDLKEFINWYIQDFKKQNGKEPEVSNLNVKYAIIKKYYTWKGKPEVVSWIKTKNILKKINPNKLLTPAEVQNMLRVWPNDRDKCLLAMAYDSGMRIGELLSLRVEDIIFNDGEAKVRIPDNHEGVEVNAKTGSRSMVLIESLPYIEKWLNLHDCGNLLFGIKKSRAQDILKAMSKKAGIQKNVYWHLIRHTRATEMAKLGMQETAMKNRFGWTEDSGMIKRYTSLTDEDADNSYREALGLGTRKKDIAINPIARRCSKCGKLIDTGEYCPQCAEIQKLTEANTKAQIDKDRMQVAVSDLAKLVLDLTDKLDAQEVREQIMSQVVTNKSDEEINEAVKNFDPEEAEKKYIEDKEKQQASTSVPTT